MSSSSDSDSVLPKWYLLSNMSSRSCGVHPINSDRGTHGEFHHLVPQLEDDPIKFREYLRMSQATFSYILNIVEGKLTRQYRNCHSQPISPKERLVLSLRFLATGNSFRSLAFSFRMGVSTVAGIVYEVCELLWNELSPIHLRPPTMEQFERIADRFYSVWGFPNCLGAIDGKHVRIKCPAHSGSFYFNYKKYFSLVFQGVADDHYRFICVDVGGFGKQSDGGTFEVSGLGRLMQSNLLPIPPPKCLPGTTTESPHVFIADEAYKLEEHVMKPFAKSFLGRKEEVFNARLSKARKTVECAFGILYARWRILSRTIETTPDHADHIIKSICVLHNCIIDKEGYGLLPDNLPGASTQALSRSRANNRSSTAAQSVRSKFAEFFSL